jgi:hypothetical protein
MDDYINRKAAKQILSRLLVKDAAECACNLIDCILPADVEPVRHGEWRLVRRMAAFGEYECSVCGRIETFGYFNKLENNPYCHCGAKMKLEDETNDD